MVYDVTTQDKDDARRALEHHVRDALAYFYDRTHLQTSPLAAMIVSQVPAGEAQSTALRRLLRQAIESLKPDPSIPYGQPEWLGYRLLWLRYIHRKSLPYVCDELGIGRSSYYRYHQQALGALTSLLWQQAQQARAETVGDADLSDSVMPEERVIAEALSLAHESQWQGMDLHELLQSVLQIVQPLCQAQGVAFSLLSPQSPVIIYGDPTLLRQAIISLLGDYLELLESQTLLLAVYREARQTTWHLRGQVRPENGAENLECMGGYRLAQELIAVYGGRLWIETEGQSTVPVFTLPVRAPQAILIIDDDGDTIRLYRQWLQAGPYQVQAVRTRQDLDDSLSGASSDLILLDVLMPQWDGWSVLQRLKSSPETRDIPVVICSVLRQPRLADALGAAAVLCKPIEQATLMATIRDLLDPQDNPISNHPAERASNGNPP